MIEVIEEENLAASVIQGGIRAKVEVRAARKEVSATVIQARIRSKGDRGALGMNGSRGREDLEQHGAVECQSPSATRAEEQAKKAATELESDAANTATPDNSRRPPGVNLCAAWAKEAGSELRA